MRPLKSWTELPEHRKQNVACLLVLGLFCVLACCAGVCWWGPAVVGVLGR